MGQDQQIRRKNLCDFLLIPYLLCAYYILCNSYNGCLTNYGIKNFAEIQENR